MTVECTLSRLGSPSKVQNERPVSKVFKTEENSV